MQISIFLYFRLSCSFNDSEGANISLSMRSAKLLKNDKVEIVISKNNQIQKSFLNWELWRPSYFGISSSVGFETLMFMLTGREANGFSVRHHPNGSVVMKANVSVWIVFSKNHEDRFHGFLQIYVISKLAQKTLVKLVGQQCWITKDFFKNQSYLSRYLQLLKITEKRLITVFNSNKNWYTFNGKSKKG